MWRTGLVAPQHVGSSRTRAQTRAPCIGRWILNHCTTREVRCWGLCAWTSLNPQVSTTAESACKSTHLWLIPSLVVHQPWLNIRMILGALRSINPGFRWPEARLGLKIFKSSPHDSTVQPALTAPSLGCGNGLVWKTVGGIHLTC